MKDSKRTGSATRPPAVAPTVPKPQTTSGVEIRTGERPSFLAPKPPKNN